MASKNKSVLKREHAQNKTFAYSKGNVNLSFTLRTDVKAELKDFKDVLEVAIQEVEEEIKKVGKK